MPFLTARARRRGPAVPAVVRATAVAAVVSGAPSTVHALVSGRDPLHAARAAASLLGLPVDQGVRSLAGGAVAHALVSAWWGAVLAVTLPPGRRTRWAVAAGAGIFVLDLQVIARLTRRAAITGLPPVPQLADHLAFTVTVGYLLDRWDDRWDEVPTG